MADQVQYVNPRVRVIMMDGGEFEAQTLNPDLLAYERTAAKHRWPEPGKSPLLWLTFIAWKAAKREGHIPSEVTWEQFSEELVAEVQNPDARRGGGVAVDPTEPEPVTG